MISVIIPVYNDPAGLTTTLESLVAQQTDLPFEIIVADNGSNDKTQQVAKDYIKRYSDRVQLVIEAEQKGSYAARNKAIDSATGEILCFIDADMSAPADYLKEIAKTFEDRAIQYVGCKVKVYTDKKTLAAKYNQLNGFVVHSDLEHNHFVPTCCLSIRKSVLDVVGRFDPRLESGGDYEFGNRVYMAGLNQAYVDSVELLHPARWKYRSIKTKSKRVARGICQLAHFYPEKYRSRYLRYYSLKRHRPANPLSLLKKAKQKKLPLRWWEAFILSVWHIPITIASSKEAKNYMRTLDSNSSAQQADTAENGSEPLVSVNITTFNRAQFLGRCLDSVLDQNYRNIEVIVVDDASTDNTTEIAERYRQQDNRVQYFRHTQNKGNAYARNTALSHCKGLYVAFMDDDDEWIDADKLAKQVRVFQHSNDPKLGIVCSGVKVIDASEQETIKKAVPPHNLVATLLKGNGVIHNSTVMTKRSIMEQVNGFDTKMPRGIDSEFFRTVVVKYGYHVNFMPDITAAYHEHGESRMTTNKSNAAAKTWNANVHVIKKHLGSFLQHPGALIHRLVYRFKKIVAN